MYIFQKNNAKNLIVRFTSAYSLAIIKKENFIDFMTLSKKNDPK